MHVVDSSHPNLWEQIETVEDTLAEIEVPDIPRILVMNKIDLRDDSDSVLETDKQLNYEAVVGISALNNIGIEDLLNVVESVFKDSMINIKVLIPYQDGQVSSWLHEQAIIKEETHTNDGVIMDILLAKRDVQLIKKYQI